MSRPEDISVNQMTADKPTNSLDATNATEETATPVAVETSDTSEEYDVNPVWGRHFKGMLSGRPALP
jgi:hypothetical protein